jgi:hypothetical protein
MGKVIQSEIVELPVSEVEGCLCAWAGCGASFSEEMPAGWVYLLMWWSPVATPDLTIGSVSGSPFCKRDAVLCPLHAKELESKLKDVGSALRDVVGSA